MNNPLMVAVSRRLVERGHSVIRFNFRGTGASTGTHDFGAAEKLDLNAAVEHARELALPLGLAGWSFGAGVALNWLADQDESIPYVGIAPGPEPLPDVLPPGPKRLILGTREQVIDGAGLQTYAIAKGIDLVLTPGDHFFHGRGEKIGDLVGQGLEA
jgi:alpha/beta superfamily hydrolase